MSSSASRKFEFLRQIASGGFGSVFLVKVIHGDGFSRLAAIKLLHPKWSENEEIAARMRDEARLLGWLRHKNIVDVMDLTRIHGRVAVIMEYLEAVDVRVLLTHCTKTGEPMPLRSALEVCAFVASALDAAYNRPPYEGEQPLRVIHRDIKPSNVMVDAQGMVKVLDFGVARADFDQREAHTQEMSFGSIEYMPPERMFFEPDTRTSDVYSLGSTLYEMLAGERLGKAEVREQRHERLVARRIEHLFGARTVPEDLGDALRDLLVSMLAFDSADRPDSAACQSALKHLSRQCRDPAVDEWAESVVPALFEEFKRGASKLEADAIVGKVVREDKGGIAPTTPLPPSNRDLSPSAKNERPVVAMVAPGSAGLGSGLTPVSVMARTTPSPPAQRSSSPNSARRGASGQRVHSVPTLSRQPPEAAASDLGRGSSVALIASAVVALIVLVLGVVAVAAALIFVRQLEPTGPIESPSPAAQADRAAPTGPAAVFQSKAAGMRKLKVSCDGMVDAHGVHSATVPIKGAPTCTVTGLFEHRPRLDVVVTGVSARTYECFAGGAKECR